MKSRTCKFGSAAHLSPQRILIRMPNWLGDLVMATPVLADVRRHWPDAKMAAMCQGAIGAVLKEDPHIDELFIFQKPSRWLHKPVHGDMLDSLIKGRYDLGILLTNSFSSAWWLWRGHVSYRIGYATHWRSWLLDCPVAWPPNRDKQHLVTTYKMLLEPLGIPLSDASPKLYITSQENQQARQLLASYHAGPEQTIIGINPGAAYGSAKCWPPERFRELAERLLQDPRLVLLFFGDKSGAPMVNSICMQLPGRAINLAGKTSIRELMALIQCCQLLLTNDSGPMHIASALDVPLIALFGSTSDAATGPYKGGKVIHKHVPCSPCYRRECPIDFRCMTQISVEEVYQEILKMLRERRLLSLPTAISISKN